MSSFSRVEISRFCTQNRANMRAIASISSTKPENFPSRKIQPDLFRGSLRSLGLQNLACDPYIPEIGPKPQYLETLA